MQWAPTPQQIPRRRNYCATQTRPVSVEAGDWRVKTASFRFGEPQDLAF